LSICAWKVIKAYLKSAVPDGSAVPGASIAVQTYGDFLNFNPHLHAIVSDGCFLDAGDFHMAPGFMLEYLEDIFQYEVLKMLKKEGKITDAIIENMLSWRHSGFNVYVGDRNYSDDEASLGNLARYIMRACFSRERMVYIPAEASDDITAKVVYTSKDRESRKTFNALDWPARLVTHITGRYEQTVRYYGYYSNKSRGMRKKAVTDDNIPAVMPSEMSSKESRSGAIFQVFDNFFMICYTCLAKRKFLSFFILRTAIPCTQPPPGSHGHRIAGITDGLDKGIFSDPF